LEVLSEALATALPAAASAAGKNARAQGNPRGRGTLWSLSVALVTLIRIL
jgi:hypothetical protein